MEQRNQKHIYKFQDQFKTEPILNHEDSRATDWDRVPPCAEQKLLEEARGLEAAQAERRAGSDEHKQRIGNLQAAWSDIQNLEMELKNCFLYTEEKIKDLDISGNPQEEEETKSQEIETRSAWLEKRIAELNMTRDCIEDETRKLMHYKEFLESVSVSDPDNYPAGATSVIQHYERLCSARSELETRQTTALHQLQELRIQAQDFTVQALTHLDSQQAQIMETKEKLELEKKLRDEWTVKLHELRTSSQSLDSEESELRGAMTVLYEQIWRRYHPNTSPPNRNIEEQCNYVQLVMTALQKLVESRRAPSPPRSQSVEPQISECSSKPHNRRSLAFSIDRK